MTLMLFLHGCKNAKALENIMTLIKIKMERKFSVFIYYFFTYSEFPKIQMFQTKMFYYIRHVSRSENLGGRAVLLGDDVPPGRDRVN